ncbi:MAG: hypothetical protein ACJ8LL_14405 [Candidatus Udaeobacter sp.]
MATAPLALIEPAQSFDDGSMPVDPDDELAQNGHHPPLRRPVSYSVWSTCAIGIQTSRHCGRDFTAAVLSLLAAFASPDGRVRVSDGWIAEELHRHPRSVRNATHLLEHSGHVRADRRQGRAAVYRLLRDERDEQLTQRSLTMLATMRPQSDVARWAATVRGLCSNPSVGVDRQRRVLNALASFADAKGYTNVGVPLLARCLQGLYQGDVRNALRALEQTRHVVREFEQAGSPTTRRLATGDGSFAG